MALAEKYKIALAEEVARQSNGKLNSMYLLMLSTEKLIAMLQPVDLTTMLPFDSTIPIDPGGGAFLHRKKTLTHRR